MNRILQVVIILGLFLNPLIIIAQNFTVTFPDKKPNSSNFIELGPQKSNTAFSIKVQIKNNLAQVTDDDQNYLVTFDSWSSIFPTWYTIAPASQNITGGSSAQFTITLTPPAGSDFAPGDYDFLYWLYFKAQKQSNAAITESAKSPYQLMLWLDDIAPVKLNEPSVTAALPSSILINGVHYYDDDHINVLTNTIKVSTNTYTTQKDYYDVSGLIGNTTYAVSITSKDAAGNSSTATDVSVKTFPGAPGNLNASGITSASCKLSWTAPEGGTEGYNIYKDGSFLSTTPATSFLVSDLSPSTAYSFVVKAKNSVGESAAATKSVTTCPVVPSAPTDLNVANITDNGCTLSWTASTGIVTAYNVYANGSLIQTSTSGSITLQNLGSGTSYTLTVSASNCGGESAQSNAINILTRPSAPTGLTAGTVTNITCALS
jgi:hypothetical protein